MIKLPRSAIDHSRLSSWWVAEGVWVRPFGTAEGAGFGWGEGTVSGEVLRGNLRWANYPRRREDGVWTPDLRGVIKGEDGAEIPHLSARAERPRGSHERWAPGDPYAGGALSADESYRWLNISFIVGEGEIDEETEEWWVQAYVCINEMVQHPPALGDLPPGRFRQADR